VKKKLTAEDLEASAWAAAVAPRIIQDEVPSGWYTIKQLSVKLGKSRSSLNRLLQDALADGRCEMRDFRVASGRLVRKVPHYHPKA
jgi:AraC-like DNA-binding protein